MFAELRFRYPFRRYQQMILDQIAADAGDGRYHLVAPPGAGKTIVGLELVRRIGAPAVIFAPTTTIQMQWQDKLSMFSENPELPGRIASVSRADLAPINIFTYQLIATPAESRVQLDEIARQQWLAELIDEAQAADRPAAENRLQKLATNNPGAYRRELTRRRSRVRRDLLREDDVDIAPFLHRNARGLIDDLVASGVRTVVLDECHHLLDYWAIVLRYLLQRIGQPHVIGLTATLPDPDSKREEENYWSLLGEIDFEVPTPAVVKEGNLAPYRDLVYFVHPSERENDYLHDLQGAFEQTISRLTTSEPFRDWVLQSVWKPKADDGAPVDWGEFERGRPLLALALLRFMHRISYPIPRELLPPQAAFAAMTVDDWAVLLERYGLDVLKVSAATDDHDQLATLRRVLLGFGLTLTERGLRQGRSAGDLVLAFSEAKDIAVADVLAAEMAQLGERLRAVVITDFERMTSGVAHLDGILDDDAGSARRLFHHLVHDPVAGQLEPIMVTGRSLLVDADHGPELLARFNDYLKAAGLRAECHYQDTASNQVREVTGSGPDWSARAYVAMVTELFEEGVTRCLVGTRGIFGEGWDALSLNTLIDLTSVTTSTSVQQLRGRSLRHDPAWPRKVAHNWDIICIAPDFARGDNDLSRLSRRHEHYWGIVAPTAAWQGRVPTLTAAPAITRGLGHLHPNLANEVAARLFERINFAEYSRLMLRQIPLREVVYDWWHHEGAYANEVASALEVDPADLQLQTAFSGRYTLRQLLLHLGLALAALLSLLVWIGLALTALIGGLVVFIPVLLCVTLPLSGAALWLAGRSLQRAREAGRSLGQPQTPPAMLRDIAAAVLTGLQNAMLMTREVELEQIQIVPVDAGRYQVTLAGVTPAEADHFVRALNQVFAPIADQRYLIQYDLRTTQAGWLYRLWAGRRQADPSLSHFPVPEALSSHKDLAEGFAAGWRHFVGGGELVFTRSETGRLLLRQLRAADRPQAEALPFQRWI